MTVYLLWQPAHGSNHNRVCAVLAGDKEEAKYKAKENYGGEWSVKSPISTLEELRNCVEDSSMESVLLNY